jgi:hypothetical protein
LCLLCVVDKVADFTTSVSVVQRIHIVCVCVCVCERASKYVWFRHFNNVAAKPVLGCCATGKRKEIHMLMHHVICVRDRR